MRHACSPSERCEQNGCMHAARLSDEGSVSRIVVSARVAQDPGSCEPRGAAQLSAREQAAEARVDAARAEAAAAAAAAERAAAGQSEALEKANAAAAQAAAQAPPSVPVRLCLQGPPRLDFPLSHPALHSPVNPPTNPPKAGGPRQRLRGSHNPRGPAGRRPPYRARRRQVRGGARGSPPPPPRVRSPAAPVSRSGRRPTDPLPKFRARSSRRRPGLRS